MMSGGDYDAVVIGAGPAGALAARGLAASGVRVLLVDKHPFPRPKVCGCCLNRVALVNLERAGLGGLVRSLGARDLRRLDMVAGGRHAEIALPRGVSLSREALDTALVEEARSQGVAFRGGVSARVETDRKTDGPIHRVTLRGGESVTAKVVVVADGLGGTSLKGMPGFEVDSAAAARLGFGGHAGPGEHSGRLHLPDDTIVMACGRHGYLGAVRLEDGRVDLAAAVDAAAVKRTGGWAEVARQIVREAGLPVDAWPIDAVERWRATPALTRRRRRLAGPGLFVVGDAAGYVEPFTGEGMAWAIAGGTAVVPIALRAVEGWDEQQQRDWNHVYNRRVRHRQAGCRWVAAALRRPRLTRGLVRVFTVAPAVARPLVRHITKPGPDPNGLDFGRRTSPRRPALPDAAQSLSPGSPA